MLTYTKQIDIQILCNVPKNNGMFSLGHSLIPLVISENLYAALPEADSFFLRHAIFSRTKKGIIKQPFFACQSKFGYTILRGEKPDIFMGTPVPEAERDYTCPECGRKSRRERRPWYLYENEWPMYALSATSLGLIAHNSVVQSIDKNLLRAVRIEEIKMKSLP